MDTPSFEVESAELLPFSRHDECVGGFSAVVSVIAIGNISQQGLSLAHACRVKCPHPLA
jgi:hypothetical protein